MKYPTERPGGQGHALLIAGVVAAILMASLAIDVQPRFHLGDSASFINTRLGGFIPDTRSWIYGLALGWITRATQQLISTALLQIAFSWAAYAVFVTAVARSTRIDFRVSVLLFLVGCLEPLGYFWSRAFMSDSFAQSVFVLLSATLLVRMNAVVRFILVFAAGVALISLRVVYFAPTLAALVATAAWSAWGPRTSSTDELAGATRSRRALPWIVAVVALLAANFTYAIMNTEMTKGHKLSTGIGDMEFLVAALSPLAGDQLDSTPLTSAERASLIPLTYENRIGNEWGSNGLVPMIHNHFASTEAARPAMRRLATQIVLHHPFGIAGLVVRQWSDYLNPHLVWSYHRKGWWSGAVPYDQPTDLPDSVLETFKGWGAWPIPSADLPAKKSVALWYFEVAGGSWSIILAYFATSIAPVSYVIARKRSGNVNPFLVLFPLFYLGEIVFASPDLITRYLLPLAPPLLYAVGFAVSAYLPVKQPVAWPGEIKPLSPHGPGQLDEATPSPQAQ